MKQRIPFHKLILERISTIDPWLGTCFALEIPSYTKDPNTITTGSGPYQEKEWSSSREQGCEELNFNSTKVENDEAYLKYIFSIEAEKVISAIKLADNFEFSEYKSILELGCGPGAQAFVLKNKFPHTQIKATDFDSFIIENLSKVMLLDNIKKDVLDLNCLDASILQDFDLLITWGVEYAFKEDQMLNLLKSAKESSVPYLMCTPSIVGLMGYFKHLVLAKNKERKVSEKLLRVHGWSRSLKYHRQIAAKAMMDIKVIGWSGSYFCILFQP